MTLLPKTNNLGSLPELLSELRRNKWKIKGLNTMGVYFYFISRGKVKLLVVSTGTETWVVKSIPAGQVKRTVLNPYGRSKLPLDR